MKFLAELKRCSQRKAASLDNVYQIVLETENSEVLDLGKYNPETNFKIDIKGENEDGS
jgi:hypothetical protein